MLEKRVAAISVNTEKSPPIVVAWDPKEPQKKLQEGEKALVLAKVPLRLAMRMLFMDSNVVPPAEHSAWITAPQRLTIEHRNGVGMVLVSTVLLEGSQGEFVRAYKLPINVEFTELPQLA